MEGLDEGWVDAGTRRFVNYSDMNPGKYIFRVIGSNNDGIWNEEGKSIEIVIYPPWYKTIWAYVSYGVLFLLSLFGFIRWRTWRLEKDKRVLETQVKERTFQISQQKDEIEAQRDELEQNTYRVSSNYGNPQSVRCAQQDHRCVSGGGVHRKHGSGGDFLGRSVCPRCCGSFRHRFYLSL